MVLGSVMVEILHTNLALQLIPKIWKLTLADKNWARDQGGAGGRKTCFDFYNRNILMSG